MSRLKFSAQEDWTVTDLQVFFHQLNILYNRVHVIHSLNSGRTGRLSNILNGSLSQVPEADQLFVDYIEIHSPAKFSLKGADKIIDQVRGLIKDLWYENSLDKKKKEQLLRHQEKLNDLEVSHQRTNLLEKQIDVLKSVGFSEAEIQNNIRKLTDPVEKISTVMQQRKVILIDDNKNY